MAINEYWIYDITNIISIILSVVMVYKTVDWCIFKSLKSEQWL